MMGDYYILQGRTPIPCDLWTWADWFQKADRRIAFTRIGNCTISTVFLGIDHNFFEEGPPILFETMIFGRDEDENQWQYSSYDEAIAGHDEQVARLLQASDVC